MLIMRQSTLNKQIKFCQKRNQEHIQDNIAHKHAIVKEEPLSVSALPE